jgi:hypothetical protein
MKLIINSPRLGTVGAEFTPSEGINIEALIEGGFLVSTTEPKKSSKVKSEPIEE